MAKYADGFITISEKASTISKLINSLENVWIQNGKNINQMDRTIYLTVNINENKKKSKEESDKFIKSYYGLNFWEETWGPFGTPEEVENFEAWATILKSGQVKSIDDAIECYNYWKKYHGFDIT